MISLDAYEWSFIQHVWFCLSQLNLKRGVNGSCRGFSKL